MAAKNFVFGKFDRFIKSCTATEDECCETANICLINATACACEALKNLVIPGIASFMIVDPSVISLETNYFLEECTFGQSAALCCASLMADLNEDVTGGFVANNISAVLQDNPDFFKSFDVVIGSNLKEEEIKIVAKKLWEDDIPFLYCRVVGFYGSLRFQMREQIAIERKPIESMYDLRLTHQFPALKDYLENTPVIENAPWLLVLNKYLKAWQKNLAGGPDMKRVPSTPSERQELAGLLIDSHETSEDNFEDLIKAVDFAFLYSGEVPDSLKEIFATLKEIPSFKLKEPFWILMTAINYFVEVLNNGLLPLNGIYPEMHADEAMGKELTEIYKNQTLADNTRIHEKCVIVLKKFEMPEDLITLETVCAVTRNLANLEFVRGSELSDEYERIPNSIEMLEDDVHAENQIYLQSYISFRSFERFLQTYDRLPKDTDVEADVDRFKEVAKSLMNEWEIPDKQLSEDLVYEICNYGAAELEAVSTEIGGCASELLCRVLSNQRLDLDKTILFNGVSSDVKTMKF